MLNSLINTYKSFRSASLLRQPLFSTRKQYAFIGVGLHSLTHLYPILQHHQVALKYVYTRSSKLAAQLSTRFPGAKATHTLDDICSDPSVAGVFVCTPPQAHFAIAMQLLKAGKHVYVEKPPCYSLTELTELRHAAGHKLNCFTGLQKRFAEVNKLLARHLGDATSYRCRYLLGGYPEGNAVYELFIHPVENCLRLFGTARVAFAKQISPGGSPAEYLVVLQHEKSTGILELSTAHNWNNAVDQLEIHTPKELLTVDYPNRLRGEEKTAAWFGIPLEKARRQPVVIREYFHQSGVTPSAGDSNLAIQGFLGSVSAFIGAVENNECPDQYNIGSLVSTYEILDQLHSLTSKPAAHV